MSFLVNATTTLVSQSLSILGTQTNPNSYYCSNNLNLKSGITTYGKFRAKVVSLTKFKQDSLPWIVKP